VTFGRLAIALVGLVGLMVPSQAVAQDGPKGFVGGLGGLTFGTVTSGAVAGQAGARIAPDLFVIGEVGYMRNVLPSDVRDDIDLLVDLLVLETGVPAEMTVSIPNTYGFGGIRWSPDRGSVSPFVEGGVGFGRISMKVDSAEVLGIDFSDFVQKIIEDEVGGSLRATKFLLALGGGLTARVSETLGVDVGYRYTRIATGDPAVNASMVYGAVKVAF
jgi:hypothetical protein